MKMNIDNVHQIILIATMMKFFSTMKRGIGNEPRPKRTEYNK